MREVYWPNSAHHARSGNGLGGRRFVSGSKRSRRSRAERARSTPRQTHPAPPGKWLSVEPTRRILTEPNRCRIAKASRKSDEDPIEREAHLRTLQGGPSPGQGVRDLHEPAAQAAARLRPVGSNRVDPGYPHRDRFAASGVPIVLFQQTERGNGRPRYLRTDTR